jgi:hypothetical protein
MSIPAPAILAITVLLGWPLVQIVTILVWGKSLSRTLQAVALRSWTSIRSSRANKAQQIENSPVSGRTRLVAAHAVGHTFGLLLIVVVLRSLEHLVQAVTASPEGASLLVKGMGVLLVGFYAAMAASDLWHGWRDSRAAKQERDNS